MDPTTASAAPRNVWHLNPKGTKVRVISFDEATQHYLVESERGVKTPVPGTYPLTPIAPDAPAGRPSIEQLVGRPRDQVEPHLPLLSENELENLGARDTRMWVTDAVMKEIDKRAKAAPPLTPFARAVASVAPTVKAVLGADAVAAIEAGKVTLPPLQLSDEPDTSGAREGGRIHRMSNGARVSPFKADSPYCVAWLAGYDETIGEPAEVHASPIPSTPVSDEKYSAAGDSVATPPNLEAERIPEAGGRSAAFMLGHDSFALGTTLIDAIERNTIDQFDKVAVSEFKAGFDAAADLHADPYFAKNRAVAGDIVVDDPRTDEVEALAAAAPSELTEEGEPRCTSLHPATGLRCEHHVGHQWTHGYAGAGSGPSDGDRIWWPLSDAENATLTASARGRLAASAAVPASPRGFCPECGREGERLKNGAIRQHQAIGARPGAEKCVGSGLPALAAPAPKVASAPYTPTELEAIRVESAAKARALRDGYEADQLAVNRALPDAEVLNILENALNAVEAGVGSVIMVQDECDTALEAREFLRPHLRPALDLLEQLPLRQEGWNKVEDHLRAAILTLDANPSAAQESQTTAPTATANTLSTPSENVLQSSAANAEPANGCDGDEFGAASTFFTPPTTAPESAPEPLGTIRLLVGTVRESAAALAGCYDVDVLRLALGWEATHQQRPTVLSRIEERLHRIEAGTAKPRRDEAAAAPPLPPRLPNVGDATEALRALASVVEAAARMGVRVEIKISPDPALLTP